MVIGYLSAFAYGEGDMINTPYDDVFRTLLNDCTELVIPVVNEIFGESYSGKEQIITVQNELFMMRQDGNTKEKITDTCFVIISVSVQGTIRSETSEFVFPHRYFHSAYALYASFKYLAGTQIGQFLTLRPQPWKFRLFSRQTIEAYWTYAD